MVHVHNPITGNEAVLSRDRPDHYELVDADGKVTLLPKHGRLSDLPDNTTSTCPENGLPTVLVEIRNEQTIRLDRFAPFSSRPLSFLQLLRDRRVEYVRTSSLKKARKPRAPKDPNAPKSSRSGQPRRRNTSSVDAQQRIDSVVQSVAASNPTLASALLNALSILDATEKAKRPAPKPRKKRTQ